MTSLVRACRDGDLESVRILLDTSARTTSSARAKRAVASAKNEALSISCTKGHLEIVRLLLNRGADAREEEALCNACYEGHLEIVRLLLDRGAEPTTVALAFACSEDHLEIVRLLLNRGADARAKNEALRISFFFGPNLEIVRLLLNHGAEPTGQDFFIACMKGHIEIVRFLLNRGAKPTGQAFFYACESGHIEIAKLLLDYAADPEVLLRNIEEMATNGQRITNEEGREFSESARGYIYRDLRALRATSKPVPDFGDKNWSNRADKLLKDRYLRENVLLYLRGGSDPVLLEKVFGTEAATQGLTRRRLFKNLAGERRVSSRRLSLPEIKVPRLPSKTGTDFFRDLNGPVRSIRRKTFFKSKSKTKKSK